MVAPSHMAPVPASTSKSFYRITVIVGAPPTWLRSPVREDSCIVLLLGASPQSPTSAWSLVMLVKPTGPVGMKTTVRLLTALCSCLLQRRSFSNWTPPQSPWRPGSKGGNQDEMITRD